MSRARRPDDDRRRRALHPEQRAAIIASYPAHEREARIKGIPSMGSGRVFPVPRSRSSASRSRSRRTGRRSTAGLRLGSPVRGVNLAWDRDADVIYVCKEYAQRESDAVIHAAAIKPWGAWIPCAWPHDGLQHDKGSGEPLKAQYAGPGPEHAAREGDVRGRLQRGRGRRDGHARPDADRPLEGVLHLRRLAQEFRLYHRVDGLIVKERDDRISASRYGLMMLRFAKTEPRDDYGRSGAMKPDATPTPGTRP
jgi:hypothetical protein